MVGGKWGTSIWGYRQPENGPGGAKLSGNSPGWKHVASGPEQRGSTVAEAWCLGYVLQRQEPVERVVP